MSSKNKMFYEVILSRASACLCVLMIHVIEFTLANTDVDRFMEILLNALRVVMNVGTPIFIFIFIFLIARRYPVEIPKNFISKRLKYLGLPYLAMAIFYSPTGLEHGTPWNIQSIGFQFLRNIGGNFHGYFILIILQFLFIHKWLALRLASWRPAYVIAGSFFINAAYLSFFNFVPPFDLPGAEYFWKFTSWIPFLGWTFYFAIGYYCGLHYDACVKWLMKHHRLVIASPIVLTLLLIGLKAAGFPNNPTSKSVPYLIYTPVIIAFFFYTANRLKRIPQWIVAISDYSFSIYLLHVSFLLVIRELLVYIGVSLHPLMYMTLIAVVGLFGSIAVSMLINRLPFGKYVIGNVGDNRKATLELKLTPQVESYGR